MTYDVIIAGAGPAGSTCAHECAKRGLSALLLDRHRFPRKKPCGGAVAGQALAHLGFPLPEELIEQECFGAIVRIGDHRIAARSDTRVAVLVSRDRFDDFLAKKAVQAGAQFHEREKVIEVVPLGDIVEVKTDRASYRASYLVGADGVHSVVARAVRPPLPKDEMALALVGSVAAWGGKEHRDGMLDFHFGVAPLGYGWIFPHGEYASVGVMGQASKFSDPRGTLLRYARSNGIELGDIHGHFIPFGGFKRRIVSGRVLLAGDAAGFADSFQGEGIVHAVHSGKLAAQAVARAVKTGEGRDALVCYTRQADDLIRKDLRRGLFLARLIDRFPNLSVRIFFHNPRIMESYLEIPAGRLSYRRFMGLLLLRLPLALLSSFARTGFRLRRGPGTLMGD
jgi:geranylgeranyl reductase family protein